MTHLYQMIQKFNIFVNHLFYVKVCHILNEIFYYCMFYYMYFFLRCVKQKDNLR